MAKDTTEKWKKEAELLRLKLNEYEETITKLKSDDSTQEAKIENLNKLHSQKIRALMQSIQELKKQNASIRALTKENNRSKLIEKLKTELLQQEIAIQALRDLVNDNEKSDEQIIKYLNKGPPRIRPLSREEMKIKIRKLESRLGISKKNPADQAVDDLESMLDPSKSEEEYKLIDPLQNEKIVEIMEQVQNLQLEVRAKDSVIEHLRSQLRKNQDELQEYKNKETEDRILGLKVDGIKSEKQSILEKLSEHTGSVQELELKLENALMELRAKNELIASLKKNINDLLSTRGGKDKESERLRKELYQAMNSVRQLEQEHSIIKQKYDQLLEELKNKNIEIEEFKIRETVIEKPVKHLKESTDDFKDFEIEALKEKLEQIQKAGNLPDSFMAAEKAETDKFKEKNKELYTQIADLQEEVEFYQKEIVELKRQGSAKALASRVTEDKIERLDKQKFDEIVKECATLRTEISSLKKKIDEKDLQLRSLDEEKAKIELQKKQQEENLTEMKEKIMEIENRKKYLIDDNQGEISQILTNFKDVLPKIQITVPVSFMNRDLINISNNLMSRVMPNKRGK